jgi:murein DD-endopeptidase MepM/ murein hydrolase activator NlpD
MKEIIILFCLLLSAQMLSCSRAKKENFEIIPYVPDSSAYPQLSLEWDRPLDNSNVRFLGAYGVWENGGGFQEIAGEIELHLDVSGENIYALADGIVVDVQVTANHGDPITPNQVEGVWVRYGRNFLIKYYHLGFRTVGKGDRITRGQILGKTVQINNRGFWEIGIYLRENGDSWTDCPFPYFDANSQNTLLALWGDSAIARTGVSGTATPWCDGGKAYMGEKVNSRFWLDRVKISN